MRKYHMTDEELRSRYLAYNPEDDPTGAIGHGLADAVISNARREGKSIENWLNENIKGKQLAGEIKERQVVKEIYSVVSSQGVPLRDAEPLVESIFKKHGYNHISLRGRELPLSKARSVLIDYTRFLFSKYNLPTEPNDQPDIFPSK